MTGTAFSVGSIVRCRDREWVVIPSSQEGVIMLRPLSGAEEETCGIYEELVKYGVDRIETAEFPLPSLDQAGDATSVNLLFNAARLVLRDGAGPFRSLGKISVRPRPYQFVPLLMALRLNPVRLLIADDVGVGKTIEAALIARELIDRGEVKRLCVLCPPYLCDQWKRELEQKFHLDAVVINSGTVSSLERRLPSGDHSVFGYFPYTVVSIDYAKSDLHRQNFLAHCAELVIVDEAHGAALPSNRSSAQQQRHALLREVAARSDRHLILLTATPHSGIEEAFFSLLGLLDSSFRELDAWRLSEKERDRLARHFIQRRRADIVDWLGKKTPFPERIPEEVHYELSPAYKRLFNAVYEFSRELVASGETLTGWKRRLRHWTALALLRCVMSSPASAIATIRKRLQGLEPEEVRFSSLEDEYISTIYESEDREPSDRAPTEVIDDGAEDLSKAEARRLRDFARQAEELKEKEDNKLEKCAMVVGDLLREGYSPIVWCRYIATSDYVAAGLQRRLVGEFPDVRVVSVTGSLPEEDRKLKVESLSGYRYRVLVATDCLSEGINLQESFNAVVHYDLPWNPNRLEQREGRVDRFGQQKDKVKAVLLYGIDNPVDGAVLDVLLRKARRIHKTLGISVPVPADSETVMEAILQSLFFRGKDAAQMQLFDAPEAQDIGRRWNEFADRERESRTRFAQRAIKPDEVDRELRETDSVLGDPETVREFVLESCRRMGVTMRSNRDGTLLVESTDKLPSTVREALPAGRPLLCFDAPPPEGALYVGRNHPFVTALARHLLEEALAGKPGALASRCGVMRTGRVNRRTVLLLLRCRYAMRLPEGRELLAEEVLPLAFTGTPPEVSWLPREEVLDLLREARPDGNVIAGERVDVLQKAVAWYQGLERPIGNLLRERARALQESHRRVREAARIPRRGLVVTRHLPPDLLGVFVLLPVPRGVRG